MARPKQAPTRSINRLATRTDRVTRVNYNETETLRKRESQTGMSPDPALIRMQMVGRLQLRDLVLRSVAAACKLVTPRGEHPGLNDFRLEVVTAVGEAFNNIVLHSYEGRDDGVVELDIQAMPDQISIVFRDWGDSFDPDSVPLPDLDTLPESGLGIFIMKTLMDIRYHAGQPNVLTLSKKLTNKSSHAESVTDPLGGKK